MGEGRGGVAGEHASADCPTNTAAGVAWSYYDPSKGGFLPDSDIREEQKKE